MNLKLFFNDKAHSSESLACASHIKDKYRLLVEKRLSSIFDPPQKNLIGRGLSTHLTNESPLIKSGRHLEEIVCLYLSTCLSASLSFFSVARFRQRRFGFPISRLNGSKFPCLWSVERLDDLIRGVHVRQQHHEQKWFL